MLVAEVLRQGVLRDNNLLLLRVQGTTRVLFLSLLDGGPISHHANLPMVFS